MDILLRKLGGDCEVSYVFFNQTMFTIDFYIDFKFGEVRDVVCFIYWIFNCLYSIC